MNWIKNRGDVSTPPTQSNVHIRLSEPRENGDDIWWNQDPRGWDWLRQSCMIVEYAEIEKDGHG